jgi:hypothetical protein
MERMMADLGTTSATTPRSTQPCRRRSPNIWSTTPPIPAAVRYSDKLLRGVSATNAPLRITELPKWVKEHRKVPDREWKHKEVRTKANCAACHTDAERGYYED